MQVLGKCRTVVLTVALSRSSHKERSWAESTLCCRLKQAQRPTKP